MSIKLDREPESAGDQIPGPSNHGVVRRIAPLQPPADSGLHVGPCNEGSDLGGIALQDGADAGSHRQDIVSSAPDGAGLSSSSGGAPFLPQAGENEILRQITPELTAAPNDQPDSLRNDADPSDCTQQQKPHIHSKPKPSRASDPIEIRLQRYLERRTTPEAAGHQNGRDAHGRWNTVYLSPQTGPAAVVPASMFK